MNYGNNEVQNTNQNINVQNQQKKPKYWLIPVLVFLFGVISKIIELTLKIIEFNSNFVSVFFSTVFIICMLAFWPCVILAAVLYGKKK